MIQRFALVFILIAGLLVSVYLLGQRTGFFGRADISAVPKDIRISNISDNSFTISWITDKPVNGFVSFGTSDELGEIANDDRDVTSPKPRRTHHVTLKKLNPATTYFYKINSGNLTKQTTAPTTKDTPSLPEPIFGKVSPSSEAIIYSTIGNSTLLSSYTRDDGNFLITLNNARTKDLNSYVEVLDSDQINLEVKTSDSSIEKQIKADSRKSAIQLVLENIKPLKTSWPSDFNNDGSVNVIDYAFYIKDQLFAK